VWVWVWVWVCARALSNVGAPVCEGFATFMEYLAVGASAASLGRDAWDVESWRSGVRTGALNLDALENSHPIHQEARTPRDIDLLFDGISYSKGGSVLSMLYHSSLGGETMRMALHNYLTKHAYSNSHAEQLWAELGELTNGTDINALMTNWIETPGYPVIELIAQNDTYVARQQRYFANMQGAL
jgi:aminopeptidase N